MIRLACPRCKTVHERAEQDAGVTFSCANCGQRLQIPESARGAAPPLANQHIQAGFGLPLPTEGAAEAEPPPLPRRAEAYGDDSAVPPRRRPRWDDDDGIRRFTRSGRPLDEDDCAQSATIGFFCSLVGVVLLMVGFVLWMALVTDRPRGPNLSPIVFVVLILGLISFVLGLIGVIFSSRGLDPINQRNRGMGVAGLVCGIVVMVLGLIGSVVFFCIGMVFISMP